MRATGRLFKWTSARHGPFRFLAMLLGAVMMISVSAAPVVMASTAPTTANSIPPQVIEYAAQHRDSPGCVSGTINPFSIESTNCPTSTGAVINGLSTNSSGGTQKLRVIPATSYSITCSGVCLSGTDNSGSKWYELWDAVLDPVPTNPSTTYTTGVGGTPYVSEWMGLSTCVPSCTGDIVQGGISYGSDGSSDSQHPGLWVEFYAYTGTCNTSFCGNYMATASGDDDNWEMSYQSSSSQWLLYGQDYTKSTYIAYYNSNVPYTAFAYGLVADEGHGVNGAGYWPGSATFTYVVGEDINGAYQLGTQGTNYATPSGTSLTSYITYSTSSCYAGTCASVGLQVT
jgi:hypothetical protein